MSDISKLPFGLNITGHERTIQQYQESAEAAVNSLWGSIFSDIEQNDKVFSGDVAKEINKYNQQAYNLGAVMRDGIERPNLDLRM